MRILRRGQKGWGAENFVQEAVCIRIRLKRNQFMSDADKTEREKKINDV